MLDGEGEEQEGEGHVGDAGPFDIGRDEGESCVVGELPTRRKIMMMVRTTMGLGICEALAVYILKEVESSAK